MLTHAGTQKIETRRLVLRPFVIGDAESVFRHWAADAQVQNGYGEPVYPIRREVEGLLA